MASSCIPRLFRLQPASARRVILQQQQQQQNHSSSNSPRYPVRVPMASISTPPPGQYEWLVIVPDKPGTAQKRLEVRPQHFEGLKPHIESGKFKTGGAVLNDKPEAEDPSKFDWYGSAIVMVAASKEEVKELLAKDVYTKSGVWDTENAQILAAKFAFRNP